MFTVPNFFTLLNLFFGITGIILVLGNNTEQVYFTVGFCLLADFLDGFTARLLKQSSPIGKELDSLADMVSFGVLPAILYFQLLRIQGMDFGIAIYFVFIIALASALRLAKFNLDERQTNYFVGLNTPANTILTLGVSSSLLKYDIFSPEFVLYLIVSLTLIQSVLLISEMRFISLKFSKFSWNENKSRWILLMGSALLMVFISLPLALIAIILLYHMVSWVDTLIRSK
jgi:CDP-diacylglycerol--serine O-phosphatidyltransferase